MSLNNKWDEQGENARIIKAPIFRKGPHGTSGICKWFAGFPQFATSLELSCFQIMSIKKRQY